MATSLATSTPAAATVTTASTVTATPAEGGGGGGATMSLESAARLLSSVPLSQLPLLRGTPRYPHATLFAAYADLASHLSVNTRLRWEQLGLVCRRSKWGGTERRGGEQGREVRSTVGGVAA